MHRMVSSGLMATKEVVEGGGGGEVRVAAMLPLNEDPPQVEERPPLLTFGVAAIDTVLPKSLLREREAVAGKGGGLRALL